MKVPNGEGAVFFRPFRFSSPANGGDGGKLIWKSGGRGPGPESALAQAREVYPVRIDGVFLQKVIHQAGYDFRFPPEVGAWALRGSYDEGQILAFHDLGRSVLLDQVQVASPFATTMEKDQKRPFPFGRF